LFSTLAAVSGSFGKVTAYAIRGNLAITTRNASVHAFDISGPASVTTSFGTIEVKDIAGPAALANQNGNVLANNIRGQLSVDTSFGSVRAEDIRGQVEVDNSNGSVTVSNAAGSAHVRTTFGPVFLKQINGAMQVENQNGSITVSDIAAGRCNDISLRTSFGSVKVDLPSSPSYRVTARTTFGRITVPDGLHSTQTDTDQSVSGTLGAGGCKLELRNSNGSITIGD